MERPDPVILEDIVALGQRGLDQVGLVVETMKGEVEVLIVVGKVGPGALGHFAAVDRVVGDPDVIDIAADFQTSSSSEPSSMGGVDVLTGSRARIFWRMPLLAAAIVPASISMMSIRKSIFFTNPPRIFCFCMILT